MTRVVGWAFLLAVGVLSLPLTALMFDGQGSENWILPVQVVIVAGVGALIGIGLRGFVGGSTARRAALGALAGLAAAVVGLVVFFFLLSGLDGA